MKDSSDTAFLSSRLKLFNSLQWLPFCEEVKIAKCCVAYKRIKGEVPLYIEDSLRLNSQQYSRVTRYSSINFICPKFNQVTEGSRSFAVSTCQLWNSLTLDAYEDCSPGPLGGVAEHCDRDDVPIAKVSDLTICYGRKR